MVSRGENTLSQWAAELSLLQGRVFSQSAIQAKLQFRHEAFAKQLLDYVLGRRFFQGTSPELNSGLFQAFGQVYLQDSMCLKLPSNLSVFYPGAHSKTGQSATARFQWLMDLKSGQTLEVELESYRDNDQQYAYHILRWLRAGDLIIRDLGYLVL